MIRIWIILVAFTFILHKFYRIKRRILLAKSFIFINEIKKGTELSAAIYRANLFDFMTRKEANNILHQAEIDVYKDYENKASNLIFRASSWGFIDTHTKEIFKKRKKTLKSLENALITQDASVFSGNAEKIAKESIFKYWDENALTLLSLHPKVCVLKILLERYKDKKEPFCTAVATQIANDISKDTQYLDKQDLDVIQAWDNLIKNKNKLGGKKK